MTENKIRVVMVCAMGMSSSLVEAATIKAANAAGYEFDMVSISSQQMGIFDFDTHPVDIVLIAPQVRYKRRSILKMAEPRGIIVENIDPVTYGMVDGEKLFQQILKAFEAKDSD
jgi:PTS system cellobiose-specific IIB component